MRFLKTGGKSLLLGLATAACLLSTNIGVAADHNDPNAVNSIFSDIAPNAADLYGMFGYPSDDTSQGESVVIQLTFASVPKAGTFDKDMMYKIKLQPAQRIGSALKDDSLEGMLNSLKVIKNSFFNFKASEIKVTFNDKNQAKVDFDGFPGGDFSEIVDTNKVINIDTPGGKSIKTFIGGRDDPFFNDLPGFFRSINYGPQFYNIPSTAKYDERELPIPKSLIELDNNKLFNYDPKDPQHGRGVKHDLPENASIDWNGNKFLKDKDGNFHFAYGGIDARAGKNVNALVFEIPLSFITENPQTDRIVRTWGESYVLKASSKVKHYAPGTLTRFWLWIKSMFTTVGEFDDNDSDYNQVDHDGVPFSDAALSERKDENVGVDNFKLGPEFVRRFAHLGWGFGPSVTALGLPTCFDDDNAPVSVYKVYKRLETAKAFLRVKKCLFQKLNMPDDSWNPKHMDIPLHLTFEVFVPNLTSIDMDTTGTWPYGRRPEDQVATRFLSLFLDMSKNCGDKPCNIETLNNPALWDNAPIVPHTVPNPPHNDTPFLDHFPYLADPWPEGKNW